MDFGTQLPGDSGTARHDAARKRQRGRPVAFVKIERMWTMNPAHPLVPRDSFQLFEPFGVSADISCSNSLVASRMDYEFLFQLVNPRDDWYSTPWRRVLSDGEPAVITTVDFPQPQRRLRFPNFQLQISWPFYFFAMWGVGAFAVPGVFAVRAQIQVVGFDEFDMTEPYAFTYQLRGPSPLGVSVTVDTFGNELAPG